ncbi:MAG: hypothetical protein COA79_12545 [Planctomycetota bacterium]|nr:MAG: hypothetical protein COA79_12545 [Planctomycetota bacterium]
MSENNITNFEKEVYFKYFSLVESVCNKRLIDKSQLNDAVQSTFLLYVQKQNIIKSELSSWFYWSSHNICMAINKRVKKELSNVDIDEVNIIDKDSESNIEFQKVFESISKSKKELLLMRYYDQLSYKEIGDRVKCTENAACQKVERIISYIQNKLTKKDILISLLFTTMIPNKELISSELNSNVFILQNTVIQQSIVKGVLKMYLITTLQKSILLVLLILLSGLIIVIGQEQVKKNNLSTSKTKEGEHSVQKKKPENITKYKISEGEFILVYSYTVGQRTIQNLKKGELKLEGSKIKFTVKKSKDVKQHQYNGTVVDGKYIFKLDDTKKLIGKLIKNNVISGSVYMDENKDGDIRKYGFFKILPEKTRK